MQRSTRPLKIATYNVHRCVGRDRQFDSERILAVIRDLDGDVLALQELQWRAQDALHLLNDFAARLGYTAVAGPTLIDDRGHYGNAILSRLPLTQLSRIDLTVAGREPRGAIDARFQSGQDTLRVIATHLGLRPYERREQVHKLLSCIGTQPALTTVLIGDLNEWFLWGRPLRWLRRFFAPTPAPPTFPSGWPIFSLDRIWVKPRARLRALAVHKLPPAPIASDHLPVKAVIEIGEI